MITDKLKKNFWKIMIAIAVVIVVIGAAIFSANTKILVAEKQNDTTSEFNAEGYHLYIDDFRNDELYLAFAQGMGSLPYRYYEVYIDGKRVSRDRINDAQERIVIYDDVAIGKQCDIEITFNDYGYGDSGVEDITFALNGLYILDALDKNQYDGEMGSGIEHLVLINSGNLTDLSLVSQTPKLKSLYMKSNQRVKNLNHIKDCEDLERIKLSNCTALKDIKGLTTLTKLEHIEITDCRLVENLNGLRSTDLSYIILDGCTNFESIDVSLPNLRIGSFSDCSSLRNLDFLRDNAVLEALTITDNNYIEGLNVIERCGNIDSLYLEDMSKLKDISAISNMSNLSRLTVANCNNIDDFSSVFDIQSIKFINLNDNQGLTNLDGVEDLSKLEVLFISGCENLDDYMYLSSEQGIQVFQ